MPPDGVHKMAVFTFGRLRGCMNSMRSMMQTRLYTVKAMAVFVTAAFFWSPAAADSAAPTPAVTELFWLPEETHCRFVRPDMPEPDPAKPQTWRYLFVTQLISDDIASAERGYMRLGGLLRELEFVSRKQTNTGEKRDYRTLGLSPVTVEIDMQAGEGEKSKLGQTILVRYTGTIKLTRGNSQRYVPFEGSCGVKPEQN